MTDERFRIDPMGDLGRSVFGRMDQASQRTRHAIRGIPHAAANVVTDAGRGFHARRLTAGEAMRVTDAFGYLVMPSRARIVKGAATSATAAAAFAKGNPAITLGNTIHFEPQRYRDDFSLGPEDSELLVHEWTHVVQYARLGYGTFFRRYGRELRHHGFDPDALYRYKTRRSTYDEETLEGQAQMAGVLTLYRLLNYAPTQRDRAALERRMAGSGVYGL